MPDATAVIIAALITALGTIIATHFAEIIDVFRPPSRRIEGDWEGDSYYLGHGPLSDSEDEQPRTPETKYLADLKQRGSRISGTMVMTEATPGVFLYKHSYKGYVKGEYFIYEMNSTRPEQFRLSTAMLHISDSGDSMKGYFVANGGRRTPGTAFAGYTIMRKRKA
jgi:hypothetical protein